ncbi:hypothetical protein J6590_019838 [Homalodisca vitripennis]|nr:hypothetical protein J6590_019838 [Homalodisca vitripennis]
MADDSISTCSQGSSCIVDDTFENRLVPLGKSGNELAQVDDPDIQHPVHQSPMNMQVTAENIDHVGTKINNITLVLKGSHVKAQHPDYLASVIRDNLENIEVGGAKVGTNHSSTLTVFVVLGFIVLFMVVCFVTLETLGNTDQFGQSNRSKSSVVTESLYRPVSTFSYPSKPLSADRPAQKPTPQPVRDSTTKRYNDSGAYYSKPYWLTFTYKNRTIYNGSSNAVPNLVPVNTQLN